LLDIPLILLFEGLTNGAIYALMALGLVVLYAVTGVINVAIGEFVMIAALTVASLRAGAVPGSVYLLVAGLLLWAVYDGIRFARERRAGRLALGLVWPVAAATVAYLAVVLLSRAQLPYVAHIAVALALTTALGPVSYRVIIQPLPRASALVYLIMTIGLHLALTGLGLAFWGPQPYTLPPFTEGRARFGPVLFDHQDLWLLALSAVLLAALWWFLGRTLHGKALRAAAVNKLGARLSGISVVRAGSTAFTISVFLAAVAGVLITPITKMAYDFGFLIGLKGFVGAIIGGLSNPAVAVAGAVFVGVAEQFSAFYVSSAYKDVLVFLLIIPVLLVRSLQHVDFEEHVE
jgi:branched-chain amino acid transport system permease protein